MFRMIAAAVTLCASIALGPQPNPKLTFEVASIKPAARQPTARLQGSVDGRSAARLERLRSDHLHSA